ncbi:MAG: hypothetical protein LUP91_12890, partial [Methylococcaceae bacterium]|nr:hypothetical protein [Methylococcaceae bacterium]
TGQFMVKPFMVSPAECMPPLPRHSHIVNYLGLQTIQSGLQAPTGRVPVLPCCKKRLYKANDLPAELGSYMISLSYCYKMTNPI